MKKWYKITIFDKEVNWASVVASGILFVGLEIWRRKYIEKQIRKDVSKAVASANIPSTQEETGLLDRIINRI